MQLSTAPPLLSTVVRGLAVAQARRRRRRRARRARGKRRRKGERTARAGG